MRITARTKEFHCFALCLLQLLPAFAFLCPAQDGSSWGHFGQHDVGYAGVATGRGGFNLPILELPTISRPTAPTSLSLLYLHLFCSSAYAADQPAFAFLCLAQAPSS